MKVSKIFLLILIVISMSNCDFPVSTSADRQSLFDKELVDSLPFNLKEYNDFLRIQDANEPWITFERIDSSGQFVVVDDYEGSISGFYFYSSQKEKLGEYRPYQFFGFTKYCYNETDFFMVALNDMDSDSLLIAHLKHDGELIKELSIKNPFPSLWLRDLKISGNNLILLLNHLNQEFKIIGFDFKLNELWQQTSENFVFYDGVNSNLNNSDLIISDKKYITKFNSKTGKETWTISPFDSTNTNEVYKTKLLLKNRFIGLFKFQGVEKENHDYFYTNCDFTILDITTGQMIYSENLPTSQDEIILYNNDCPNIEPDEFYMQRGDSTWRYRYLIKN